MELTDDSRGASSDRPRVTGFVGHGQQPVPLSVDEVIHMLTFHHRQGEPAQAGVSARKRKVEVVDFTVGDSVMVTYSGPFTGSTPPSPRSTPTLSGSGPRVEILGRETPVDLNSSRSRRSTMIVRRAGLRHIHPHR